MTLKMFLRILATPKCWIRNCRQDKRCDELIRYFLKNKSRLVIKSPYESFVEVLRWEVYSLIVELDGNAYEVWVRNKWYAYLSYWRFSVNGKDIKMDGIMPSRELCFEFYDQIERPYMEKRFPGDNAEFDLKSFILPAGENHGKD